MNIPGKPHPHRNIARERPDGIPLHPSASDSERTAADRNDPDMRQTDPRHASIDGLRPVSGRAIAALLNPRPVVLVGACSSAVDSHRSLRANFATVAWTTPLSHDPALVAFSLRPTSKTFQMVCDTRCFSINTLGIGSVDDARFCGNESGHVQDKGERIAHTLQEHQPYGGTAKPEPPLLVPYVDDAVSILDCEVESIRNVGDHELVIGYVCKALTRCPEDSQGLVCATETLLCLQHHAFTIAGDTRA